MMPHALAPTALLLLLLQWSDAVAPHGIVGPPAVEPPLAQLVQQHPDYLHDYYLYDYNTSINHVTLADNNNVSHTSINHVTLADNNNVSHTSDTNKITSHVAADTHLPNFVAVDTKNVSLELLESYGKNTSENDNVDANNSTTSEGPKVYKLMESSTGQNSTFSDVTVVTGSTEEQWVDVNSSSSVTSAPSTTTAEPTAATRMPPRHLAAYRRWLKKLAVKNKRTLEEKCGLEPTRTCERSLLSLPPAHFSFLSNNSTGRRPINTYYLRDENGRPFDIPPHLIVYAFDPETETLYHLNKNLTDKYYPLIDENDPEYRNNPIQSTLPSKEVIRQLMMKPCKKPCHRRDYVGTCRLDFACSIRDYQQMMEGSAPSTRGQEGGRVAASIIGANGCARCHLSDYNGKCRMILSCYLKSRGGRG